MAVRRYFSVYPQPGAFARMLGKKAPATTDEWVHGVATQKHQLNQQMLSAFRQPTLPEPPKPAAQAPSPAPVRLPTPKKYLRRWRDPITSEWRYAYAEKA